MALDPGGAMSTRPVQGVVQAPPSKSVTHRMFMLAAQADGECTIERPLRAADTDATLGALRALGADATERPGQVSFLPATLHAPPDVVDCQNAGTALRLIAGTVARFDGTTVLDGDASLRRRPNRPLLEALESLGAHIQATDGDKCPLEIRGPLRPGDVTIPGEASSQFVSSLLLSLPLLDGPSTVTVTPPVASRPYLELTLDVARRFGLGIDADGDTFHIQGGDRPQGGTHAVDGDWSAAAFPLAAAAITHGTVTVQGLDPESPQGDRRIMDRLTAFGCRCHTGPDGVTIEGGALRSPGTIDTRDTPDMFPALAVVAACADGTTTFTGGATLRHKESDRIHAVAEGLSVLGIQVEERPGGLVVQGGAPRGGEVHAHSDHRIHMAFRVLALAADGPVHVDGAETAAVSYPDFQADLERITGGSA